MEETTTQNDTPLPLVRYSVKERFGRNVVDNALLRYILPCIESARVSKGREWLQGAAGPLETGGETRRGAGMGARRWIQPQSGRVLYIAAQGQRGPQGYSA